MKGRIPEPDLQQGSARLGLDCMKPPWDSDRVASATAWIAVGGLAYLMFLIVRPLLVPLTWAAVFAIVFYPVHERLECRWGAARAAAFSTAGATVMVIVPLLLVATVFFREAVDAAGDLQRAFGEGRLAWLGYAWERLLERVPESQRQDLAHLVVELPRRGAMFVAAQSAPVVRNVAVFVFDLVVALFAMFFLLRDSAAIMIVVRRLVRMDPRVREQLIARTRQLVSASITSAGIVAGVQGVFGGLAFAAVGIDAPVFWGVVMAFFCLLPLGAWVVWGPAALLLAVGGDLWRAAVLALVGFAIVSAVDNVLRPMLLSGQTRSNGLLILVSLLGGVAAFGAVGLVLGPIVTSFAVALVQAYAAEDAEFVA